MKIAFLFFARSRELAGTDTCKIDLPDGMQNLNIHMSMSKLLSSLLDLLDTFRHQGTSRDQCSYCDFKIWPVVNQVLPHKMPCKLC